MKLLISSLRAHSTDRRGILKNLGFLVSGLIVFKQGLSAMKKSKNDVQLHIYLEVKNGMGTELEKLYKDAYVPAIEVQNGFLRTKLLRQYESRSNYEIDISFNSEKQRASWAISSEHQEAWPKIEAICSKITWQGFDELS
ncbi:MAG: hypothetical protein MK025_03005 [Acidobacteriia bacterium]|nr:hypothetical protein [Terriglobia bacterium]